MTDALTLSDDARLCPARELQRRVEGLRGRVPLVWSVRPRFGYGAHAPRLAWRAGVPVAQHQSTALAVHSWQAGTPVCQEGAISGEFSIEEGESALLAVTFTDDEPMVMPGRAECDARLAHTVSSWADWVAQRKYPRVWRGAVVRSSLAIKMLQFAPSGAIAAAVTTSLPEVIGGQRNWDYRYSWIRDSALALNALVRLGCSAEVHSYYWWVMHAAQLTHPRLRVLYRLSGRVPGTENELALAGYRGSAPVRNGNAAADQLQLDTYGEGLETSRRYAVEVGRLDADAGRRLAQLADFVCSNWHRRDAGIWEVRGEPLHHTQSKMMCWVALDRAADLAERGLIPDRGATRWRAVREQIHDFIQTRCVSSQHRGYARSADSDDVDAAVLLGLLLGYTDGADPVMRATVDAVNADLRHGPHVYRYRVSDGLEGTEGAFLPCSFWLAEALARTGEIQQAVDLMDELVGLANDVGLYSEEIDPATGDFLGNLPLALTHLGLINAASTITELLEEADR